MAGAPHVIDTDSGHAAAAFGDAGYTAIVQLVQCAAGGSALPALPTPDFSHYYPTTLELLSVLAMQERYPKCLPPAS